MIAPHKRSALRGLVQNKAMKHKNEFQITITGPRHSAGIMEAA